jgi:hypothetical protein
VLQGIFAILFITSSLSIFGQLPCGGSTFSLTNAQLGTVGSNVSSFTYSMTTFNMPFNVFVQKTSGNGPNFYPYGANSIWVGKDNNVNLDSVVVEITFTGEVYGVMLDFGAINNNVDGEEQIQRIYPKLLNGQLLTQGVSYTYLPGVPSGTVGGTYFVNSSKTIKANAGNADDGRLIISASTPFKKIRFTQREISALSVSGPNGILVKRISYCPVIPDIAVSVQNTNQAMNSNSSFGTVGIGNSVIKTFQISNQGTGNLNLNSISLSNGLHWQILNNPNLTVAPLDTVFLNVAFSPTTSGNLSDQITFTSNDWNEASYPVNLSGIGVASQLQLLHEGQFMPASGTVTVDSTLLGTSYMDSVYIINNGLGTLNISGVQISGSSFAWVPSVLPISLAPGSGQYLHFTFTPNAGGPLTGSLQLQSNDPNSPQSWVLGGYGIDPFAATPEIQVIYNSSDFANGAVLNFGGCLIGNTLTLPITIKNIGLANLQLSNPQSSSAQFSFGSSVVGTLAPGASISTTVLFAPNIVGLTNGILFFSTNDLDEHPFVLHLVGTGMAPNLSNCQHCNHLKVNSNPMHKAEWVDNLPIFEWQHEEGKGIAYYKIELWKISHANNTEVAVTLNGNLINTVNAPNSASHVKLVVTVPLLYKTLYSWRVTAYTSNHLPTACFKRQFTTIPKPNPLPLNCSGVPPGVAPFGTKLGAVNNVPIYKNGGCENGSYQKASTQISSQSGWTYGWQCVELPARYYFTRYRINIQGGNGKDYFDVTGNRKGLRQMANGLTTSPPKPEDIITFMRADPTSAGHVSVVKNVTPAINLGVANYSLNTFQQNWGSNVGQHLNYSISLKFQAGKWKATSTYPTTRGWVRAVPEILTPGSTNSIPTISTTTPTFTWVKHNNIKGYNVRLFRLNGTCYQQVGNTLSITGNQINGLGFPALTPGATYKWTVENMYYNVAPIVFNQSTSIASSAIKSVLSDNYYFKVSASAQGGNVGPIAVNGGAVANLFLQSLASPLNGTSIFYKNQSDWVYLDETHGNGAADILQEFSPNIGDSIALIRPGFYPLTLALNPTNIADKIKVPMIEQSAAIKFSVIHEQRLGQTLLKIQGANWKGFIMAVEGDFSQEIWPSNTREIPVRLNPGMNYFQFMVFNDQDTVLISDKWLFTDPKNTTRKIQLVNRKNLKASLYIDGDYYQHVTSNTLLTLPEGSYTLTLTSPGYRLVRFTAESDTLLVFQPELIQNERIDRVFESNPTIAHYLGAGSSFHGSEYEQVNLRITEGTELVDQNSWSDILDISSNQCCWDLAWFIDKTDQPDRLALWVSNGVKTMVLDSEAWGDSIAYDPAYQILKLKHWSSSWKVALVVSPKKSLSGDGVHFSVLPNPGSGEEVVISQRLGTETCSLKIIDGTGKVVLSKQLEFDMGATTLLNLHGILPGTYVFQFETVKRTEQVRFVRH